MFTVSLNHFLFANVMANILVMAQLQIKWNSIKKLNKLNEYNREFPGDPWLRICLAMQVTWV